MTTRDLLQHLRRRVREHIGRVRGIHLQRRLENEGVRHLYAQHDVVLPFTRMLARMADYTPRTLARCWRARKCAKLRFRWIAPFAAPTCRMLEFKPKRANVAGEPMPVSYRIDAASRTIFWKFEGAVTDEELLDAVRMLDADPEYRPDYSRLIETMHASPAFLTGEVLRLIAGRAPRTDFGRTALVADTDAAYGMCRMFQAYSEDAGCQVFRQRSEALAWLAGN